MLRPFQCSSASRKFLNWSLLPPTYASPEFQCSSASRKFLNSDCTPRSAAATSVSVLFSEPKIPQYRRQPARSVPARRFQCSSASRKFLNSCSSTGSASSAACFSALQRAENSSIVFGEAAGVTHSAGFSALQRAENSSMKQIPARRRSFRSFQCSSASRKFLNSTTDRRE